MIAIVGSNYEIEKNSVFLGETVFLQEYLGTSNCFLCYGHSTSDTKLLSLEIIEEIINLEGIKGKVATNNATEDDLTKILGTERKPIKTVTRAEEKSVSEAEMGTHSKQCLLLVRLQWLACHKK